MPAIQAIVVSGPHMVEWLRSQERGADRIYVSPAFNVGPTNVKESLKRRRERKLWSWLAARASVFHVINGGMNSVSGFFGLLLLCFWSHFTVTDRKETEVLTRCWLMALETVGLLLMSATAAMM